MEAAARIELGPWPARGVSRRGEFVRGVLAVAALLALAAALHGSGADHAVASALYDPARGAWQLDQDLLRLAHELERVVILGLLLAALGTLAASVARPALRRWRRPLAYLLACFALTVGLVSLGKHVTNMDCPRALAAYGGDRPDVGLFEPRPAGLPPARCFPAGHSSSALALLALYFVPGVPGRRRRAGLVAVAGLALAFAFTQWARGMHFPSHDAVSAAIAWAVALAVAAAFRRVPGGR